MPRSKRTVIDESEEFGFSNYGTQWYDRGVEQTYTATPIAPEDDWITIGLAAPIRLPDGTVVDTVTVWGRGLLTFGAPTAAQRAYMATLPGATDLRAFVDGFPGDVIDAGLQTAAYGGIEHGGGVRDFVANPFGVFHDPHDPDPSGPAKFDHAQARGFAYVTWFGEPLEGVADDWEGVENVPSGPGGLNSVQFSDEGFRIGSLGGTVRFGEMDLTVGGDGFVYYSELNPVSLTGDADVASVAGGPEQLVGLGGDDRLTGGAHADRLDGGDDNDVLVGGGGVDRLFGGDGDDDLSDGDEQGLLSGGAGNDVLRPGGGEDTIDGGEGVDRIVFDYANWGGAIGFALDAGRTDYLLPGDLYKSITGVEAVTFTASGGDDRLGGGTGGDVLTGAGGQDSLIGNEGDDLLSGGDDHDYLEGGAGDDWLDGGSGWGPAMFVAGSDYGVYDLDAHPYLLVRATEQQFYPDWAGWYGDFYFTATSMAQSLTLELSATDGDDAIYSISIYAIDADGNTRSVYEGGYFGGSSTLSFDSFGYDDGSGNWVPAEPGRFYLALSTYDDRAAQVSIGLRLSGVPIPDGDTMVGGFGDDTYLVDSLYDRVLENAGEGRDTIVTSLSAYSLAALPHIERLAGDASAQALTGNAADNAIVSGGGADRLDGAGGDDRLVITDTPALVDGGVGVDTLVIAAGGDVTLAPGLVSGIEKVLVQGGAALDCSALAGPLAPLRSVSDAAAGATIIGSGGADRIAGGEGADTLRGGAGDDLIALARQAAAIDGGDGFDTLKLAGTPGTAYAFAGESLAGVERILLGSGVTLDLKGLVDASAVRLTGGAQVFGSDGADRIHGSAEADVIAGGGGGDRMAGGDGADRFVFLSAADAPHGDKPRDLITDFDAAAGDRLDLSALSGGNFSFLGGDAFTGEAAAGVEVRVVAQGDRSVVQVDLDHDAKADLSFLVHTAAPLAVGDFVF